MNPLTNVKNLQKLNERELELGIVGKKSWHDEYKDSAWIFIGGLPYDLSEGDVICVFSQYGEVVNLNLIRDHKTGKSKGYAFLCYEDQRSTVLAVDNLNGIKILGRTIRVDHVKDYKIPKEHGDEDELTQKIRDEGCAPKLHSSDEEEEEEGEDKVDSDAEKKVIKQAKKEKKKKKHKKKKKRSSATSSSSDSSDSDEEKPGSEALVEIKQERPDRGYDRALTSSHVSETRQRQGVQRSKGSRYDARDRPERNGGSRHRASDSEDDDDRGERDRNQERRDRYNRDRSASNGSHNQYDNRFVSDASRRDRNRDNERYRNIGRERDREKDSSRMRESERSWEHRSDRDSRQEERERDKRRDR